MGSSSPRRQCTSQIEICSASELSTNNQCCGDIPSAAIAFGIRRGILVHGKVPHPFHAETGMSEVHPSFPYEYPPRGMSRAEAARYIGIGTTLFDQMVGMAGCLSQS